MGSKSTKSTTQQSTSRVTTNAASTGEGMIQTNLQNVGGSVTLTDRGATGDAFDFAEGVLLRTGDFAVELISALTERDTDFVAGLGDQVADSAAPDTAVIDKFIQFGTVAAVVAAGAWAIRGVKA